MDREANLHYKIDGYHSTFLLDLDLLQEYWVDLAWLLVLIGLCCVK